MPISFPTDNSSQVGGTFTSGSTYYATVNQQKLDTTSNTLKTYIDNKQDILTASTVLLGNGGAITNINWNNITQNKPTSFASDWSTLGSKPSTFNPDLTNLYTKTQTDTFLTGKESVLSFTAPLARATNTISIDLSAYDTISLRNTALIPYINYTALNSCNFITASVSTLTNYSTTTAMNNAISTALTGYDTIVLRNTALQPYINYTVLNSCNFITASVSTLTNYSTTTSMNSAITNALTGYDTIALRNTALIPYINYTVLNSCNYITASVSTLTNYSTTTAMNSAITTALTGYDTIALRNTALLPYITGVALNSCNFITNATSSLANYTTTSGLTTILSNYSSTANTTTLISSALVPYLTQANAATTYISSSALNSCNYISSVVASNTFLTSASLGTTYLKLDGTNSMSGTLNGTTINANINLQEAGINLSTKYQSNLTAIPQIITTPTQSYPPSYLTASTSTIVNTLYGAGQYVATSSSDYPGQAFFQCLGANPSVYPGVPQWTSTGVFNTTGDYTGAGRTTIGGVSTAGEFGSIQFPYPVIMTSYTLTSASSPYNNFMMRDFVLCGSTDGTNFTQLDSRTAITWTVLQTITYTFTNTTPYTYYRIVVKKTSNFNQNSGYTGLVCDGFTLSGYEIRNGGTIRTLGIGTTALANVALNVLGTTSYTGVSLFNGNVGIGTSNPRVALDVQDKIYIGGSITANTPQTGLYGGTGDRLILWNGGTGAYPYSLGISGSTLWYSVPTGAIHSFYTGGGEVLRIAGNGNVGIGTNNPGTKLHIEHASTAANAASGGLYIYNPNAGAGNCSILGVRINGNVANRCGISMDVNGYYGWNIGINGNDTTNKTLRFNASWDNSGADRMTLDYNGTLSLTNGTWHQSMDGVARIWFDANGRTYFHQGGNTGYTFRNTGQGDVVTIDNSGNINTTGGLTLSGNLNGGYNVSKKSILSITPTYVSAGAGSYYTFNIDVTQYISGCPGPYSTMYVFRASLWTNTGDWGDTGNNVETMSYNCYISGYAGGKSRFYQVYNSSSYSYLFYPGTGTSLYYWGGTVGGGGGTKILILENIAYY